MGAGDFGNGGGGRTRLEARGQRAASLLRDARWPFFWGCMVLSAGIVAFRAVLAL
jgi:hypothetical protein